MTVRRVCLPTQRGVKLRRKQSRWNLNKLVFYHSAIVVDSVAPYYSIKTTDITPAVTPAIAPALTPLLLLELKSVTASRGRIRVTVSISDFLARVSSSSEGCSTS